MSLIAGVIAGAARRRSNDAAAWFSRVEAAGGSFDLTAYDVDYTEAYTKAVWTAFVAGLKTDGTWDQIHEITPYFGVSGIGGITQKLKFFDNYDVSTNTNYVSMDLVSAGAAPGLFGSATKFLNTNTPIMDLAGSSFSMGALTGTLVGSFTLFFGSSYAPSGDMDRLYLGTIGGAATCGIGSYSPSVGTTAAAVYAVNGFGASATFYQNGSSIASGAWNWQGFQAGTFQVGRVGGAADNETPVRAYYLADGEVNHAAIATRLNAALAAFA